MIRKSFLILDRFGREKEKKLWQSGISDWQKFLRTRNVPGVSVTKKAYFNRQLLSAQKALYSFDSRYFTARLPRPEHWRLYDFFKEDCVYLDIETTGLSEEHELTVIGLYDGLSSKVMIMGLNFDYDSLRQHLQQYKMIVTFNGSAFDVPFLLKRYPDLVPDVPHFDLRHCCRRIGLTGGLKQVEKSLGIKRQNGIVDRMYGGDAVQLWRMYRATGDDYYLNLLIEYNEEDVINLKPIAEKVYEALECAEISLKKSL